MHIMQLHSAYDLMDAMIVEECNMPHRAMIKLCHRQVD